MCLICTYSYQQLNMSDFLSNVKKNTSLYNDEESSFPLLRSVPKLGLFHGIPFSSSNNAKTGGILYAIIYVGPLYTWTAP